MSKNCATAASTGDAAALAASVSHRKDTKKGGSAHELTQVSVGTLVKGKWSTAKVRRADSLPRSSSATGISGAPSRSGADLDQTPRWPRP